MGGQVTRPRLKLLARTWNRWANQYDAQAARLREGSKIAIELRAWAAAYRNAAALLVATIGDTRNGS